jgi:hypothetical protein
MGKSESRSVLFRVACESDCYRKELKMNGFQLSNRAVRAQGLAAIAALISITLAIGSRPARAGIAVTKASGSISVDINVPTEPPTPNRRDFTATVPGSDVIDFTESFSGGTGRVAYDVKQPNSRVLKADVEARISTTGIAEDGLSQFFIEFTSNRPLHFRFAAKPVDFGPQFFEAKLDDIVANARISALGDVSGTIPFDEGGVFGEFVREGTLPAGSHRFSIDSAATSSRSGGGGSAGVASFEVNAVPLPPAVWSAVIVLGTLLVVRAARHRAFSYDDRLMPQEQFVHRRIVRPLDRPDNSGDERPRRPGMRAPVPRWQSGKVGTP